MSRFCPLFSSSKGNSTYLSGGGTSLLVDMGVSLRQLTLALHEYDLTPDQLSGVLITHEHSDHIRGLAMLLKRFKIPIYGSRGTLQSLIEKNIPPPGAVLTEISDTMDIGGVEITPFDTPHDAANSTGFRFTMPDGRNIAIATDLGHMTDTVRESIYGCDLVMIESNYDRGMLDCSAYPYYLKRRIKGNFGHLSNEICAEECVRLVKSGTTRIVLAHLSEQNNHPGIAWQSASNEMCAAGMQEKNDYILSVAPPRGKTELTIF